MKEWIITAIGVVGSFIAGMLGGWDTSVITLLIFMGVDMLSGLLCALVFKASTKTNSGGISSNAGFKGLCKKGMILMVVAVGHRLDLQLGTTYIRDAICIAFMTNELVSIVENCGLMGIPIPTPILNALEVLKNKQQESNKLSSIVDNALEKLETKAETKAESKGKTNTWDN